MVCGAQEMGRRRVTVRGRDGRTIGTVVADVCAACGERYYDLGAMRALEG